MSRSIERKEADMDPPGDGRIKYSSAHVCLNRTWLFVKEPRLRLYIQNVEQ